MIHLSGERQLPASAEIVRQQLNRMNWLVSLMPNLAHVEQVEARHARFIVRPGFSFLRSELTVQLARLDDWEQLAWRLAVRGIGLSAQAIVRCSLTPIAEQTCMVQYDLTIEEVGGLLRTLHRSLLQAAMEKTVQDFLSNLDHAVATLSHQ